MSTIIRKIGWQNESELNNFWGIIFPDFLGIMILIFVVIWISK